MNEDTDMRQMPLCVDSQEASAVDPGMSELQIKELARLQKARATVKAWNKRYPNRRRAHAKVAAAIKDGTLVRPTTCNRCGHARYTVAHHANYRKPLDVEWLCDSCHKQHHIDTARNRKRKHTGS